MTVSARFFRWHRWLGWLVGLQVLIWVLGGLVFAWVPFQPWVKAGDAFVKPQQPLPAGWAAALQGLPQERGAVLAVQSVATAAGPALKVRFADGDYWQSAAGGELAPATAETVGRFAAGLYRGDGRLAAVERIAEAPRRLGIVRELGERRDLWRARFDDRLGTRLYFDGRSGELLGARNEAWVVYDFFWRLHVMDYEGGEDFNNGLLRFASAAAILLIVTGAVLSVLALGRVWRRSRKAARASASTGTSP